MRRNNLKRFAFLMMLVCASITLCGCSSFQDFLIEKSGVISDGDYSEFQRLQKENKLDEEGMFKESASGSVFITLAQNPNLNISYYRDAELTDIISSDTFYMNPGESIYASKPVAFSSASNQYTFSAFRIMTKVDENHDELISEMKPDGSLVYTIPSYFEGKELIIEPLGAFPARNLNLNAYWIDDNHSQKNAEGTWSINGTDYRSGRANISPAVSYTVSFKYDPAAFFFVSSAPQCWYHDSDKGIIEFNIENPKSAQSTFSVELHPYIEAELKVASNIIKTINGETYKATPHKIET